MGAQEGKVSYELMVKRQLLPAVHRMTIETLGPVVALMNVILAMT